MKKLVSILVLVAMMLASVLAIVPAAAADETEVINFLPDGVYDKVKTAFDGVGATDYSFGVAPFVYTNNAINEILADSKVLSIKIPVNKTGVADDDGKLVFTLSTYKADKVNVVSEAVNVYKIKINPADYGIEAEKTVNKFIAVDLRSYNVVVAADEVLTFAAAGDTIVPAWANNDTFAVQKVFRENCNEYVGFACNVGKEGYSANPNSSIFFDFELEKKVGWDEKEDTAGAIDFTNYETRRLWTDEIYAGIKALYEADGAKTIDWVPSAAPFAPVNAIFQNRMAGTRLRSITLPVNKTLKADADGNFIFTIHTFKRAELAGSSPVQSWKIKINAEQYGLTENTSAIYKFVENIDLTSYNIVIGEDEVLAFFSGSDTFLPGYSGNAAGYFSSNFPEMMGFGARAGTSDFPKNTYTSAVIFYDLTYDVPVSESYANIKELVDTVKDYEKDDFSAGFDAFKTALDAAVAKLESANEFGDFSAEYTALDTAVKGLVAITEISKTALTTAITAAAAYENKAAEYTEESYAAFTEALAAAKAVNENTDVKQSEVNAAVTALDNAIKALDKKGNTTALNAKVTEVLAKYDIDAYTANSYRPLKDAILAAQTLIEANSESYNDIEAASKAIDDAIPGLKKRADFTKINELISKYEAITDKDYTAASVDALMDIIDTIKEMRKPAKAPNVSEENGADYLARLEAAIAGLVPYADYTEIDAKLEEVDAMDEDKYTADSWKAVEDAVKAINSLKSNRNATKPESDAALKALNDAIAALVSADAESNNTNNGNNSNDATTDGAGATEGEKKEGGCGGIITTTAVVMASVLALGTAFVAKKKD